jgi:hypothetical protein
VTAGGKSLTERSDLGSLDTLCSLRAAVITWSAFGTLKVKRSPSSDDKLTSECRSLDFAVNDFNARDNKETG